MRAFGTFILGILVALAAVVLGIFAVENANAHPVQFSFLGNTFSADLWLVAVIPAVVGFILALLLTTPARAGIDAQHRALNRRYGELDREHATMRQQHEALVSQHNALQAERDTLHDEHARLLAAHQALQAEHKGLTTERDELRSRMAASSGAPGMAPAGEPVGERERAVERVDERAPEPAVERVDGRPREPVEQRDDRAASDTGRTAPNEVADERDVVREGAPEQTPEQASEQASEPQPTLGDRVRGWLRGPDRAQEDYPNGPLAPTA